MAAFALTVALTSPFTPHTTVQLEQWETDFYLRAADALSEELLAEWRHMHDVHPWFYDPKEVIIHESRYGTHVAAPPPVPWTVEQWRGLVAAYWPAEHVDRMLRIMQCESGGNPTAYNPSGATGLFQIMPNWQRTWPGDYTDPWTNTAVAYQIWLTQGYAAWVCK